MVSAAVRTLLSCALLAGTTTSPPSRLAIPVGSTWYWQLMGSLNTDRNADVYDIDLESNQATDIATLKAKGRTVVCSFSAGTYEIWREDAEDFPKASIGGSLGDWPGENWVDVRDPRVRAIMLKRFDQARSTGCDGVEPDHVDGYTNKNDLDLTRTDQIDYLKFLAKAAHDRGLSLALKNTPGVVQDVVDRFDYAVVEDCFAREECESYRPFIAKGKSVFSAEYTPYSATVCRRSHGLGFSTAFFDRKLDGKTFEACAGRYRD